jgi:DNA-binding response OmpR family regulator
MDRSPEKSRGKILLAEEDSDQRELLSELLSNAGFDVRCAATGRDILERLKEQPDLVLLDVQGGVSPSVARCLDEQPTRPALVFLSADAHLDPRAARLNPEGRIAMPFDLPVLLSTVVAVLRGRSLAQRVLSHSFD